MACNSTCFGIMYLDSGFTADAVFFDVKEAGLC